MSAHAARRQHDLAVLDIDGARRGGADVSRPGFRSQEQLLDGHSY
jgi:hypothetical protein